MTQVHQPTIETERLILRPFREADIQDIFAYASDDQVAKYVTWNVHRTIEDSKAFFEKIKEWTNAEEGKIFFIFAMELKSSTKVIGTIDFKQPHILCGQIDYAMSSKYWNQGLMAEAALAVKNWSLDKYPKIVRIQALCLSDNVGSRRVMEKIGMEFECIRRKSFIIKGEAVDLCHYCVIR
jgi:ribosomal-protein-alanine N-acetyltransferase